MAADKVVQVKNKYEDGSSTDTTTKNVLAGEKSTTYTQAPDAATQAFVQGQMKPVAQSMGIDPNTRKVVTPFEVIGYDPEKERQRREAERLLNERKKKESGWYNALSIVGDALTAAHGGNVWRREANRTAAQAERDNQRLIAEQKAEDVYNREKLRNQELAYAKMLNDAIHPYLTKTTVKDKDYEQQTETTVHGKKSGYKMDALKVSDCSSNNNDGDGSGSGGYQMVVDNTVGDQKHHVFNLSTKESNAVKDLLLARYQDVLNNLSDDEKKKFKKSLTDAKIITITGKGADEKITWNTDEILHNGKYFYLRDADRQMINELTNGKVKFTKTGDVLGEKDTFGTVPQGEQKIDADFDITK